MVKNFEQLLEKAAHIKGKTVVVIFPNNNETLSAIVQAQEKKLAEFILVGDQNIIHEKLIEIGKKINGFGIIPAHNVDDALQKSIGLIRNEKGDVLILPQ